MCTLEWLRRKHKMSKKIKHTPAAIFDMLEELQLSLEILEEKMDNIYDIVKSKPQKDYGYSSDDEYDSMPELVDDDEIIYERDALPWWNEDRAGLLRV